MKNHNSRWNDEQDFFLLQAIELAEKLGHTHTFTANCLNEFLGRTSKSVAQRLCELNKPIGYEPKKRPKIVEDTAGSHTAKNQVVEVVVTSVKGYGAFCTTVDKKYSGLLHISNMANEFINDVSNYIFVGMTLSVIMNVRPDKKVEFNAKDISPLKHLYVHQVSQPKFIM